MQIAENSEEIILRYIPVREWIIGGGLVFIGGVCFFWMLYSLLINSSFLSKSFPGNWIELVPALMIGGLFLLILYPFIRTPVVTVTINQKTKSIDAHFRRLYGIQTNRFYFMQISKFKSYKSAVNYSSKYYLALILANNKEVRLQAAIDKDKQKTIKLVKKLNKFIKSKKTLEEQ